jgi:succinoglycan biosynthesis protein ExoU
MHDHRCAGYHCKARADQIDVLIAARNRADTIERAVTSALVQNAVRAVIVIDDGSTDDTVIRARQCDTHGKKLILECLASSVGPAAARNVAIGISTAPWLAILDADDFFLPGRIAALLPQLDNCDFVADELIHIREHGEYKLPKAVSQTFATKPRVLTFEQFVLGNVSQRGSQRKELGYLQPLMRRQFLEQHGLRYNENLRFGEDYDLYARALMTGARFLLVPTRGYIAVERADSLSSRHSRLDLETLRDNDRELMTTKDLSHSQRDALVAHQWDLNRRAQWLVLVESLQSRRYLQSLSLFFRSPALTGYLAERLITEAPAQLRKRLKSRRHQ